MTRRGVSWLVAPPVALLAWLLGAGLPAVFVAGCPGLLAGWAAAALAGLPPPPGDQSGAGGEGGFADGCAGGDGGGD